VTNGNADKDLRDDDIVAETLVEGNNIKIKRFSAQRQLTRKDLGDEPKNTFLLSLHEIGRGDSKPKRGETKLLTTEKGEDTELTVAEEGSTWLAVQFDGKVGKGLFPSPDAEVLSRIKQSIKRSIIPRVESLAESRGVRVERISTIGKTASLGSCEMPWNQFVLVMEGQLDLRLEREASTSVNPQRRGFEGLLLHTEDISLKAGDYIVIPAMTRGRLEATKADGTTEMLSIYFEGTYSAAT
jgi:hypothetical protein